MVTRSSLILLIGKTISRVRGFMRASTRVVVITLASRLVTDMVVSVRVTGSV